MSFLIKQHNCIILSNELSDYSVGVNFDDIFKSYTDTYYINDKARLTETDIINIRSKLGIASNLVNSTFIGTHRK